MQKILSYFIVAMAFWLSGCKQRQEIVSPAMAPVTEAVFASGHIEPVRQFLLDAMNDGYIVEKRVEENAVVRPGQLLFVQDSINPGIQQTRTMENLQIARKNAADSSSVMKQLYAQARTARQKLITDSVQLTRMVKLYQTHSVSKMDLDNARFSFNASSNALNAAEDNIRSTRLNLQQSLINAEKDYQNAVASRNYYNLVSPGTYRIYEIYKKEGELIRKGDAVAMLGHPDSMLVVMNIDESSIAKIRLGQVVLVELNTEKGKTYRAFVSKIYPHFDDPSQSYKVEAIFRDIPLNLIAGTLLQANIIICTKAKVMLIPRTCLSPDNKVIVIRNHKNDTIPVIIGIVSNDWAEVLGGVTLNDRLIKAF